MGDGGGGAGAVVCVRAGFGAGFVDMTAAGADVRTGVVGATGGGVNAVTRARWRCTLFVDVRLCGALWR